MSKMDRMLNSKREKQTIYEIYRACRLCGAGAGYKMPIIQNVVDLDDTDIELKQKIRECVQIEVHQDDKMPPLICELCVDKVNDFYEFLDMCRQTNKRTRLRLGLPPQSMPRGAPDAEDCILGLTEPVYVNEDSDGEPLAKHKKTQLKVKVKKEPELKVKLDNRLPTDRLERSSRYKSSRRSPTPPRLTRHSKSARDDNESTRIQDKSKSSKNTPVKSILKKDKKPEETSLLSSRLKRSRDKEPVKLETSSKKVKISTKPTSHPTSKSSPKSSPRITRPARSPKISPKRPPSPPRSYKCGVCDMASKTPQAVANHMRVHVVNFTNPKLACNPCGVWFPTSDEASSHHRYHKNRSKPYHCRRCDSDFKHLSAYEDHLDDDCIPWEEMPDVKCEVCWHLFATNKLLEDHKCLGSDYRPGGKCGKCKRTYTLLKNLKKHESTCTAKKKGEIAVDPVLLAKLRPIQVRVSRCDPLLGHIKQEHYDVSSVTPDFGLDKNCVYPYISSFSGLRIKSDPDRLDGMVAIQDEIKNEFCSEEDYVHWDSEDSESDEVSFNLVPNPFATKKRVDTLATLSLKTIFSRRCLGRVPRKRRRVKPEKNVFDTLLANEDDVTRDINNIIDNLGHDDDLDGNSGEGNDNIGEGNDESAKGNDENDLAVEVSDKSVEINEELKENNGDEEISDKSAEVNDVKEDGDDKSEDVKDSSTEVDDKKPGVGDDVSHDVSMVDGNESANDSAEKTEQSAQNDVNLSEVNDDVNDSSDKNEESKDVDEKTDLNDSSKDVCDEKDINGSANYVNDDKTTCNDNSGSNNDLSSRDNDINDDLLQKDNTIKVNNGTINYKTIDKNSEECHKSEIDSNKVDDPSKSEKDSRISNDENQNESGMNDDELSSRNDKKSDVTPETEQESTNFIENSQDSNSIGTFSDSLLNDNTQSDDNEKSNVKCINDNAVSETEQNNSEIDENKSQDDISLENSQDSKIFESELDIVDKTNDSDSSAQKKSNDNNSLDDTREQTHVSINDSDIKSVIGNKEKSENSNKSDEIDDTKLMEALDAEIGDSNDSTSDRQTDKFNDKIALEDLISTKNTEKSMDIDILPDEFNFDT